MQLKQEKKLEKDDALDRHATKYLKLKKLKTEETIN